MLLGFDASTLDIAMSVRYGGRAIRYAIQAMPDPLIALPLLDADDAPLLIAVQTRASDVRETASHHHARGQLLGATRGLLTLGTAAGQWVVPAIHAVWVPPHHPHSLRSHGPYEGWSAYVAEAACAALPDQPCTLRTSGLLREAVARAASWSAAPLDAARLRIAQVILDEVCTLPRESLGLPMPRDPRLLRIARALADRLDDTRGLEDWAAWAGVASRTLSRRFVAETGFSFTDWRQRARLMRALEQLAAGVPVTTIALELGYETVSAFIAMFKRHFGVTPSRYAGSDTQA